MTRYKSHLLDRMERLSDKIKWAVVVVAALGALAILLFGLLQHPRTPALSPAVAEVQGEQPAAQPAGRQPEAAQPEAKPAPAQQQPQAARPAPTQQKPAERPQPAAAKPAPARTQSKPAAEQRRQEQPPAAPQDDTRYVTEIDGYSIQGIMLLEGAPPEVLIKKGGDVRSYRIGDKVGNWTVESIHRYHVVLKSGKTIVHLNRVQF